MSILRLMLVLPSSPLISYREPLHLASSCARFISNRKLAQPYPCLCGLPIRAMRGNTPRRSGTILTCPCPRDRKRARSEQMNVNLSSLPPAAACALPRREKGGCTIRGGQTGWENVGRELMANSLLYGFSSCKESEGQSPSCWGKMRPQGL